MKKLLAFILTWWILANPSAYAGDTTTNGYFYLPSLGASGAGERTTWLNTLEATDAVINGLTAGTSKWMDGGLFIRPTGGESVLVGKTTSVGGTGNLELTPSTTTKGNIYSGTQLLLSIYGESLDGSDENLFLGLGAGNLTTEGESDTGIGKGALNSLTANGDFNTCVGADCGTAITEGSYNACLGPDCLGAVSTGNYNTAIGFQAGFDIELGEYNICLGYDSCNGGSSGMDGIENTIIGASAGGDLTDGDSNTIVGSFSGTAITSGNFNTIIGKSAFISATSAQDNTCAGVSCLRVTTGSANTALGVSAGRSLTTAGTNTLIGVNAGRTLTTGSNNIFIGGGAGYTGQTNSVSNSVGIGVGVVTTASNQFILGTSAHTVQVAGTLSTTGTVFIGSASSHAGQTTCFTTAGRLGYCVSAVGAGGACTCTGL